MSFRVHCPVDVRFRDCDAMGHVNHAVYFTYLEIGRFAYSNELKFRNNPSYIMARAECDFRSSARTGNRLLVGLGVTRIGRTSFTMDYEVTGPEGQLVVTARTVQVVYDYEKRKPVPFPADLRSRIEAFEGLRASERSDIV